ncbi:MAG: hypothetical protein WC517_02865 [Patescibacteria group bacterium]
MRYLLGAAKTKIDLSQADVIGSGGEAVIYNDPTDPGKAIKVYHDPTALRSQKLSHFFQRRLNLPGSVIVPRQPLYATRGTAIVGFQMDKLPGNFTPLAMLMRSDFCNAHGITTKFKAIVCLSLLRGIHIVHQNPGVNVGDVNDQNEIIVDLSTGEVYWIDIDSWQIDQFPCMVGTEDYISPDLYNQDLSKKPCFANKDDFYAYSVLAFRILLMVHPFSSGIHLRFRSLFDRAKNGMTVLDQEVRYPRKAQPREILSDELTMTLLQFLKRQRSDSFPIKVLEDYVNELIECPQCHLNYPASRDNCPGCAAKTVKAAKIAAKIAGCACEIILETSGRLLWHQLAGGDICLLADEGGLTVFYRKLPGQPIRRVELFKTLPDARYVIFDNTLVVCADPGSTDPELLLIEIDSGRIRGLGKSATNCYSGGSAVFGSSGRRLYRLAGSSLLSGSLFGDSLADRQVMEVIPNQTKFFVANNQELTDRQEVVFGAQRILGDLLWFLAVGDTDGRQYVHHNLNLPEMETGEAMIDASIRFGVKSVLVLRHTRQHGINYVRRDIVRITDAQLISSDKIKVVDALLYDEIHGKGFTDHQVLHATEDGIAMEDLTGGRSVILPGTDNYVSGGEKLIRFGNGILVVTGDRVFCLKPENK